MAGSPWRLLAFPGWLAPTDPLSFPSLRPYARHVPPSRHRLPLARYLRHCPASAPLPSMWARGAPAALCWPQEGTGRAAGRAPLGDASARQTRQQQQHRCPAKCQLVGTSTSWQAPGGIAFLTAYGHADFHVPPKTHGLLFPLFLLARLKFNWCPAKCQPVGTSLQVLGGHLLHATLWGQQMSTFPQETWAPCKAFPLGQAEIQQVPSKMSAGKF